MLLICFNFQKPLPENQPKRPKGEVLRLPNIHFLRAILVSGRVHDFISKLKKKDMIILLSLVIPLPMFGPVSPVSTSSNLPLRPLPSAQQRPSSWDVSRKVGTQTSPPVTAIYRNKHPPKEKRPVFFGCFQLMAGPVGLWGPCGFGALRIRGSST